MTRGDGSAVGGRRYARQSPEERRADHRERLIAAAFDLFSDAGFNATKINDICVAAGTSARTFYEIFHEGQIDLLKVAYERCADEAIGVVETVVSGIAESSPARTRAAVEAYVLHVTDDPRRARILYREAVNGGEQMLPLRERTAERLAVLLADHQQGHLVAKGVVAALDGLLSAWAQTADPGDVSKISEAVLHIAGRSFEDQPESASNPQHPLRWKPAAPVPRINMDVASTARMYDWLLDGKDNYAVDREAVERLLEVMPESRELARANREFMRRAVRYCATATDQFIDLGTGIPTSPNVDEVARQVNPKANVVGVDNDAVVLSHARALRTGVTIIEGDVRQPEQVLRDLAPVVDLDQPVTLVATSLLNFIPDDPAALMRVFLAAMAPGSLMVISHGTDEGAPPETVARFREVYNQAAAPAVFRTVAEITGIFDGLEMLDPGLVDVQHWRPDHLVDPVLDIRMLGGVSRVPGTWPPQAGLGLGQKRR
jgi:AcrR family transcriptional regulator/trans-aconitate methyltransferase